MSGGIFLIQDGGALSKLTEEPFSSEDDFQKLLASYPDLLPGDQVAPEDPRRWLLVTREAGIPDRASGSDRFSLDHLFLDQDAIPTLVEVKRSSDTRLRREVVGQLLDYAANAVVYWPTEKIRAQYEEHCKQDGYDPSARLRESLEIDIDDDAFWQKVRENLEIGKIRMVFVADEIPPELQRVVEFLNWQMNPGEVLAVELRHFVGQGIKTIVPRLFGQTQMAVDKKGANPPRTEPWDELSFLERLRQGRHPEDADVADKILQLAMQAGLVFQGGRGRRCASLAIGYEGFKPLWMQEGNIDKRLEIWLSIDKISRSGMQPEVVAEVCGLLNRIKGVSTSPQDASRKIGSCEILQSEDAWLLFSEALTRLSRALVAAAKRQPPPQL